MEYGTTHAVLSGIVRNPELRHTPGGLAILEFTLAAETDGRPAYHRVKLLGKPAEHWTGRLKDGLGAIASGRIDVATWKKDGIYRSFTSVVPDQLGVFAPDPAMLSKPDTKGGHRLLGAINEVFAKGVLKRDADHRHLPNGTPLTRILLEVEQGKQTFTLEVEAWEDAALSFAELKKGQALWVFGALKQASWQDETGKRQFATRIELKRGFVLEEAVAEEAEGGLPLDDLVPEEDLPF